MVRVPEKMTIRIGRDTSAKVSISKAEQIITACHTLSEKGDPMNEFVAILDFGGQYKQLIARRVRECNVYCEILPYTTSLEALTARNPKGIILTGGPNSVYDPESPTYDRKLFELGII